MSQYNPFGESDDSFVPPPKKKSFNIQEKLKKLRNFSAVLILFIFCGATIYSGAYILDSGKVAVITTMGKYTETQTSSGLNFMLPFIQRRHIVDVSNVRRMEFGYREDANGSVDVPEEGTMITMDECLVVADWTIQYNISDGYNWLFNVDDPEGTLRIISESSYRRIVASHSLDDILTDKKDQIQREVMSDLQEVCNDYNMGVKITAVQLQDAMPPEPVYAAFLDVTSAKEDKTAKINEAQKYANEKLPVSRGEAEKLLQESEGYKQERINEAIGSTARYNALLSAYANQPSVTKTRLYLEMISQVLPNLKNIYITDANGSTLQFLPVGKGE